MKNNFSIYTFFIRNDFNNCQNFFNNILKGNAGSNVIVGGRGYDTATYDGKKENYQIKRNSDGSYLITNLQTQEIDTLKEIEEIKFSDLEFIFKNFKSLFKKQGYIINWKDLEKQSLNQTINTLSMASPFSLEEKQILLESKTLDLRKQKLEEILKTYATDNYNINTVQ